MDADTQLSLSRLRPAAVHQFDHRAPDDLGDHIGGEYVDAPQQTSYAGCPNSHYWKLGPADIEWQPDPDRRYGEAVGE